MASPVNPRVERPLDLHPSGKESGAAGKGVKADTNAIMTKKKSSSESDHGSMPRCEREAKIYMQRLHAYIIKHKGQYLRGEDGSLHLILDGRRIPLLSSRENQELPRLMIDACGVSLVTQGAQAALQRLQVEAFKNAGGMTFRKFSGLSPDRSRIYIPVEGGQLLCITAAGITQVPNGANPDKLWIEHPYGKPFLYDPKPSGGGLNDFERLMIETQACRVPAMRWFVGMHEGFFPYVRDFCRARFLMEHSGGTQEGKTSGAERYIQLHGLGEVKGDCTVAFLANEGDIGLLALDNREQANFDQGLIDYCLFLATGAERGRSTSDGQVRRSSSRPAVVITSIEGAWKAELRARRVEVMYEVKGKKIGREDIENEITARRHEILSAMIPVFQVWLQRRSEQPRRKFWDECPLPDFESHLSVLAELLCAYAEVAKKPEGWAEEIIDEWVRQLSHESDEAEDDLEWYLQQILDLPQCDEFEEPAKISHEGQPGTLHVTQAGLLLVLLRKRRVPEELLTKNANGLSRRLSSAKFRGFKFLTEATAPHVEQLKRVATKRPIGFFVPDQK